MEEKNHQQVQFPRTANTLESLFSIEKWDLREREVTFEYPTAIRRAISNSRKHWTDIPWPIVTMDTYAQFTHALNYYYKFMLLLPRCASLIWCALRPEEVKQEIGTSPHFEVTKANE